MELYDYEKKHIALLRRFAPECMVLLKQDGHFPLVAPGKIALYGSGARNTLKGGTGSGDVNVRHYTTVEEGLENAGFTITTKSWLDDYDAVRKDAHEDFITGIKARAQEMGVPAIMLGMGAVMSEPEYILPLEGEGDTAVYVLGRVSGEGSDRVAAPGDFALTGGEIRDILACAEKYENFLLVLNVGGVVDISPVLSVGNILLLSQLGITVGDSLADVILGKAYPSGKLASTWAKWEDYCCLGDFAEQDDTRYREGIYVGYRYFDSINKAPLFPFGYGLSYTTFSLDDLQTTLLGDLVTISVHVKNAGVRPGKEVVQVYVSVPAGRVDQPYQVLAAFAKTKELSPGEAEELKLSFPLERLASFDSTTACSVLEEGSYVLRVGTSSRDTKICGVVWLEENIIVEKLSHVGGEPDFADWRPEERPYCSPNEEEQLDAAPVFPVKASDFKPQSALTSLEIPKEITDWVHARTDEELMRLCLGAYQDASNQSVVGNAGQQVVGTAGETARVHDLPAIIMADGPAGLRLDKDYGKDENGVYSLGAALPAGLEEFLDEKTTAGLGDLAHSQPQRHGEILHQYCSAIPIGTALAQSFNLDLCRQCGDLVGEEMERFGVHLWLAPALNIHRSPLCGRNFEYYSEDPLISGQVAAAITQGVQKHPGRGTTIKHFCCNNQETNRMRSNSIVSERALRDIYLKGFEICVKESQPYALMTSYNLLNGEHTSERRDLIMTCLRGEWGYRGMVMTDWVIPYMASALPGRHPVACASGSIRAGNDIHMPGSPLDYTDLRQALDNPQAPYPITREDLETCAARIVQMVRKLAG